MHDNNSIEKLSMDLVRENVLYPVEEWAAYPVKNKKDEDKVLDALQSIFSAIENAPHYAIPELIKSCAKAALTTGNDRIKNFLIGTIDTYATTHTGLASKATDILIRDFFKLPAALQALGNIGATHKTTTDQILDFMMEDIRPTEIHHKINPLKFTDKYLPIINNHTHKKKEPETLYSLAKIARAHENHALSISDYLSYVATGYIVATTTVPIVNTGRNKQIGGMYYYHDAATRKAAVLAITDAAIEQPSARAQALNVMNHVILTGELDKSNLERFCQLIDRCSWDSEIRPIIKTLRSSIEATEKRRSPLIKVFSLCTGKSFAKKLEEKLEAKQFDHYESLPGYRERPNLPLPK